MNYAIGIDLGGTSVKYGLVDTNGSIAFEQTIPTRAEEGATALIGRLTSVVVDCLLVARKKKFKVVGVGVGTPGIVDRSFRIVLGGADNIPGWSDIALAASLEAVCGLPVSINNDANMMGLGEQQFGAARSFSDVVFLTVGTGIGGAVISNNELFGGYNNRGGELGHIPLYANGVDCSCGGKGCLEAYASTSALVDKYRNRVIEKGINQTDNVDGRFIINLYKKGDSLATQVLEEHWRDLGHGIAGLVNIFSPQRVVVGGGIVEAGDFYIQRLDSYFRRFVMPDCSNHTVLCAAELGNKAGMLGAAQWAFSRIAQASQNY